MKKLRAVGLIPARFASSRFPGKLLANLNGRPVLEWAYLSAKKSKAFERIIVATDDYRILRAAANFGAETVMTKPNHPSGTDRIAEAAGKLNCDVVVNLQGDHPFVPAAMIRNLLASLADKKVQVATLAYPEKDGEKLKNPNLVKVVFDKKNFALYFSRSTIPWEAKEAFVHIGLYAFRKNFLAKLVKLKPTTLEKTEKLEQLRMLENGTPLQVVLVREAVPSIDAPVDMAKAFAWAEQRGWI
ncbi:MAG TPA: 3-deoxy-manno-octulosonate cytidylyltransferase [candidate division Zixibacteria bacterium]|nr:3-deoxy-manno-octulosonate cytidylyltransferase [candidate division Zixibacteria bacterium]